MDRIEEIWNAAEQAFNEMMKDDEQFCHPESFRWGFEQGVDWAEKDLALSLAQVVKLDSIIINMVGEGYSDGYKTRPFYEEVLKRFNEQRNEGKS